MAELPRHIAIIMDGNGRWAVQHGLPRIKGHIKGGEIASEIIKLCSEKKIFALTLFAFSTENWKRPKKEVESLMRHFLQSLRKYTKNLQKLNICLKIIGDREALDKKLQQEIALVEQKTANNTGLRLNVAINYSGKWDIVGACKTIAHEVLQKKITVQDISAELFSSKLCLHDLPEVDLFIRTSGEYRISNFLLWQLAYTELFFTDTLWPDFSKDHFEEALKVYAARERRFGGV